MTRFRPFAGLRYDPSLPLDEVIAPPYDVVSSPERETLAARHPANAIHVELPREDAAAGLDRYEEASRLLSAWIDEGVVRVDDTPSMYSYRMTEPGGSSTTGVIGALGCEPHDGDVLAHEQTIPKDKSDRLSLLRACRTNLSPIWGLSLTEGLTKTYAPLGAPDASATDDDGVRHELWVIDDPSTIEAITQAVAQSPVVIADGHHRYETALAYRAERRAAHADAEGEYDLVMALVVELAEDQLAVGPVHRVLRGLPAGADPIEVFGRWFECRRVGAAGAETATEVVGRGELGLLTRAGVWRMTPLEETVRLAAADLDSSLVALVTEDMPDATVEYRHDLQAVIDDVLSGRAEAALLLRAVTVAQIARWAHARKRMPPKSTYFHPKPRTGMVFRPVSG